MKGLGPIIDKAVGLDDSDPAAVEALERLRAVLTFCGKRLGGSDPLTILPAPLDAMAGAFESQKFEIEAFISDRNVGHLATANGFADTALASLAQIPGVSSSEELIGLIQAIASHRTALEEQERLSSAARKLANTQIQDLTTSIETFQAQTEKATAELKAQLDAERQKLSTLASEQQKLFADAQLSRSTTFNETLLKIQENLTKTLTDQQGQFSTAQENRNLQFTTSQTESQKRFGDLIADHTKRLTDQDAEFTRQRETFATTAQSQLKALNEDL